MLYIANNTRGSDTAIFFKAANIMNEHVKIFNNEKLTRTKCEQ